jgi:hypothetical protein
MMRVAIATAWVWVALAQPAAVCARAPRVAFTSELAALRGGLPSMCALTPSAAAPLLPVVTAGGERALPTPSPLDENPIAWCSSPDDPRCSSRDASSLPGAGHGQVPLNSAGGVALPGLRPPEAARAPRALQLGAAREAQASRVERPPRAPAGCGYQRPALSAVSACRRPALSVFWQRPALSVFSLTSARRCQFSG